MRKIITVFMLVTIINLISSHAMALPAMEFTQYAKYKKICLWIKKAQEQIVHLTNVISNQVKMIEDMKRQALTIPDIVYFNTAGAVGDIAKIVRQGQMVTSNLSNFDNQFKQKIDGYKRNFKTNLKYTQKQAAFSKAYKQLSADNMGAIKGVLKLINAQGLNFQNHVQIRGKIKNMCENSDSRNKLLQANSILRDHQIELLENLNNTVTAQANMEAALNVTGNQIKQQRQRMKDQFYQSRAGETIRGNGIPFP